MKSVVVSPVWHTGHVARSWSTAGYQSTWITRSRSVNRFGGYVLVARGLGPLVDGAYLAAGKWSADWMTWRANQLFVSRAKRALRREVWGAAWTTSSIGHSFVRWLRPRTEWLVLEERSVHPEWEASVLAQEARKWNVQYERPRWHDAWHEEYPEADRLVVASEFAKRTLVDCGVRGDKVVIVPYGLEASLGRSNLGERLRRADRFRALFVGRIGLQKGVPYLLAAWERAALPDAVLTLVGPIERGFAPVLRRMRTASVTWIGPRPHEAVLRMMAESDATVVPSVFDSYNLVLAESLRSGTPVIATSATGCTETLKGGVSVIPPRSVESLVNALTAQYKNRSRRLDSPIVQAPTWDTYATEVRRLLVH